MKQMLLLSLIIGFALNVSAQKIKEREIDKFTKLETISTSVETLYTRSTFLGSGRYQFKFYIRKRGEQSYTIFAKISTPECEKYDDSSGISLLLSNGDVIKLRTSYTGVSGLEHISSSSKIYTFETAFILSKEDVLKLKEFDITDVRVTTMDSYHDQELMNKKRSIIKRMLIMLDE